MSRSHIKVRHRDLKISSMCTTDGRKTQESPETQEPTVWFINTAGMSRKPYNTVVRQGLAHNGYPLTLHMLYVTCTSLHTCTHMHNTLYTHTHVMHIHAHIKKIKIKDIIEMKML